MNQTDNSVMNDQHDNVPLSNALINGGPGTRITIDRKTPPRLGWRSAQVTISGPALPSPVTFTVHWRDPSTCYVGLRKFCRPDENGIEELADATEVKSIE